MEVKQFAFDMKNMIEEIRANGTAAIYCDNLIGYLDNVLKSPLPEPSERESDHYKAQLQQWIEDRKHAQQQSLEMFRSVITAGQSAIRTALLLNGGAAVAVLAFLGHLAGTLNDGVPDFAYCLILFSFGALAITVTSGLTYLSQWLYAKDQVWAQNAGFWANVGCIALGTLAYGFFVWGMFATYGAFLSL